MTKNVTVCEKNQSNFIMLSFAYLKFDNPSKHVTFYRVRGGGVEAVYLKGYKHFRIINLETM
jgi:hypothetical protein